MAGLKDHPRAESVSSVNEGRGYVASLQDMPKHMSKKEDEDREGVCLNTLGKSVRVKGVPGPSPFAAAQTKARVSLYPLEALTPAPVYFGCNDICTSKVSRQVSG